MGQSRPFLARVGIVETPKCWWCGAQEQAVVQYISIRNTEDGEESKENYPENRVHKALAYGPEEHGQVDCWQISG